MRRPPSTQPHARVGARRTLVSAAVVGVRGGAGLNMWWRWRAPRPSRRKQRVAEAPNYDWAGHDRGGGRGLPNNVRGVSAHRLGCRANAPRVSPVPLPVPLPVPTLLSLLPLSVCSTLQAHARASPVRHAPNPCTRARCHANTTGAACCVALLLTRPVPVPVPAPAQVWQRRRVCACNVRNRPFCRVLCAQRAGRVCVCCGAHARTGRRSVFLWRACTCAHALPNRNRATVGPRPVLVLALL